MGKDSKSEATLPKIFYAQFLYVLKNLFLRCLCTLKGRQNLDTPLYQKLTFHKETYIEEYPCHAYSG